jgi:hypothetical protein
VALHCLGVRPTGEHIRQPFLAEPAHLALAAFLDFFTTNPVRGDAAPEVRAPPIARVGMTLLL